MFKKKMKQLLAAVLTCAVVLGNVPTNALVRDVAAETAQEVEAQSELQVQFDQEYAAVGETLSVTVTGGEDVSYTWTIGGSQIENTTNSYTPTESDLENWIEVVVTSGSSTASVSMYFSKLPVVYIDTEGGQAITSKETYIDANLRIQGNAEFNSETTTLYDGLTEIRGRGNSTWSQPKKPYRLKLDKKTNLFGMGKSKHWVLLANYLDESLMRNTLAYDLSGAMDMEHMSTVFTTVILNGDYVGNYQLCENIRVDDTRVDIFDWEGFAEDSAAIIAEAEGLDDDTAGDLETYMVEENMGWITSGSVTFNGITYNIADYPDIEVEPITGGYILELDEYYDEVSKFKTNSNQPIMFKNPEFVNTNADMMEYVQTYVQAFEDAVQSSDYTAVYEGEDTHYSELYDFDSLVDYWLICEIFFQEEMNKKSTYMYKGIDELMKMGPIWDMDWSSGGEGNVQSTTNWATLFFSANAQANQWYKDLVKDPYFLMKVQERYWEIRYDQVADMLDAMGEHYEYLKESGAANSERWPARQSFESDYANLESWMTNHISWMDTQMNTEDAFSASFYSADSNLALSLADADGNTLNGDIALKAAADYSVEPDSAVTLSVTGTSSVSGTADVFVNSIKYTQVEVGTTAAEVAIPAEVLTAAVGEKNVIEVKITNAKGSSVSNYVTVKESSTVTDTGVDKGELYDLIYEASEKNSSGYTADSWAVFSDAYNSAYAVALKTDATQDEVNAAVESLRSAMDALVESKDPSDSSDDYDISKITYTTGSQQEGEGIELAFDNNENTFWHSQYSPSLGWYEKGESCEGYLWVQFDLEEATCIDAVRYLQRTGNGDITSYRIEGSVDGETWETITTGTWDRNDSGWKAAEFTPTVLKSVRLVATGTYASSGANKHASARELRLRTAEVSTPTPGTVDTSALDAYVKQVAGVIENSASYTEESYKVFEAAYEAAVAVLAKEELTQDEVDAALTSLQTAYEDLMAVTSGNVIPVSEMTVTAGDSQDEEGPEMAIDENEKTMWHTNWYVGDSHDNHWYQVELSSVYKVDGFRYQPRVDGSINGIITAYEVYVSMDGSEWTKVAEGDWAGDSSLKEVSFAAVDAKYVKLVPIDALSDNTIKFASAAEIRLTGTLSTQEPDPVVNPFTDVAETDYFYDAVQWAVGNGITSGMTATTFEPETSCTRAQAVTFLWRAAGQPEPSSTSTTFTDISSSAYYYNAVLWAVENGITAGLTSTKFDPEGTCTRGQIVSFLWRAAGQPEPSSFDTTFTDLVPGAYYYRAVLWAVENGITSGLTATEFAPEGTCTRGQIVCFLYRSDAI